MFHDRIKNGLFCYFLFTCAQAPGYSGQVTKDLPTTRANTLSDDADDIQKQLDNEAKDRMKFIRPQTIWILHYPSSHEGASTESIQKSHKREILKRTPCPCHLQYKENFTYSEILTNLLAESKGWDYKNQFKWKFTYPMCGGRNQSPVNIPFKGLLRTRTPRPMLYKLYNVLPKTMKVLRRGATVTLYANWACNRPFIYGGAAHSRRYIFHSLAIRQPSEHTVGGLYYPMETQALHVSVEYETLQDAICATSRDKLALLMVANIYRHSNYSHPGLIELVNATLSSNFRGVDLDPLPMEAFCPPLKEYAAYHGSLTTPPCAESVLWMVRAKPLPITRELVEILEKNTSGEPGKSQIRVVQPLNDRKIYYFE